MQPAPTYYSHTHTYKMITPPPLDRLMITTGDLPKSKSTYWSVSMVGGSGSSNYKDMLHMLEDVYSLEFDIVDRAAIAMADHVVRSHARGMLCLQL